MVKLNKNDEKRHPSRTPPIVSNKLGRSPCVYAGVCIGAQCSQEINELYWGAFSDEEHGKALFGRLNGRCFLN